jgi:hypothetical protein
MKCDNCDFVLNNNFFVWENVVHFARGFGTINSNNTQC